VSRSKRLSGVADAARRFGALAGSLDNERSVSALSVRHCPLHHLRYRPIAMFPFVS